MNPTRISIVLQREPRKWRWIGRRRWRQGSSWKGRCGQNSHACRKSRTNQTWKQWPKRRWNVETRWR